MDRESDRNFSDQIKPLNHPKFAAIHFEMPVHRGKQKQGFTLNIPLAKIYMQNLQVFFVFLHNYKTG